MSFDSKLTTTTNEAINSKRPLESPEILEDFDNFDIGNGQSSIDNAIEGNGTFHFISIRDIIKSLASHCISSNKFNQDLNRDILLIGCVNSIIIYDTLTQSKQINVNTSNPVELIAISPNYGNNNEIQQQSSLSKVNKTSFVGDDDDDLTVCYGTQKLFTIRLANESYNNNDQFSDLDNNEDDDDFAINLLKKHKLDKLDKKRKKNNFNSSSGTINKQTLVGELTSERSTNDYVTCLIQGNFNALTNSTNQTNDLIGPSIQSTSSISNSSYFDQLVVTGNNERQIRLWPLDNFDQNLQSCRVVIEESGPISCLYPINTATSISLHPNTNNLTSEPISAGANSTNNRASQKSLASSTKNSNGLPLVESQEISNLPRDIQSNNLPSDNVNHKMEFMNHFAFGLENNYIGVYRLYMSSNDDENITPRQQQQFNDNNDIALDPLSYSTTMMAFLNDNLQHQQQHHIQDKNFNADLIVRNNNSIQFERLWRLKCRQKPKHMIMYDLNGDGQDELIIGYQNGRLEARSPFTGQLLGAIRSFRSNSDNLAGLTTISYSQASSERLILIALSTRGNLIAYKPHQFRPRQPLQAYMGSMRTMNTKNSSFNNYDELSQLMINSQDSQSITTAPNLILDTNQQLETRSSNHDDLLIETRQDDLKPKFVETRQNLDYLHRLNSMHKQMIELKAECSKLLMQRLESEAKSLHNFDITINHRCNFDYNKVSNVFLSFDILINFHLVYMIN